MVKTTMETKAIPIYLSTEEEGGLSTDTPKLKFLSLHMSFRAIGLDKGHET